MSASASAPGSPAQQFAAMLRRLIDSRQWERVQEVARDWLSIDPENAEAHLAAAQAAVHLRRNADADVHLRKVLAARPNYGFALRLASITSFNLQKNAQADEYIMRAIELQPNDAMHWYQLALMRYRQGLLEAAEKHARRSLELQPQNADTINLIANCQRGNPRGQLAQYLRALEIDPENAIVHSNIGIYYLNSAHDYAKAEESFRRALQFDPTDKRAQQNLFAVLRLRDPVYRVLTLPRAFLRGASWSRPDRKVIVRIGLLLLWLSVGRYFLILFVIWLVLVWPLVKAYEYLTLSDIRAKAGVAGARRGGWRGFHRWPLAGRLAIFALLVASFWGGLYWLDEAKILPQDWVIAVAVVTLVAWYGTILAAWAKRAWRRAAASRAEKKFHQRTSGPAPRQPDPY